MRKIELTTGSIDQLGFGTYKITNEDAPEAVTSALEVGYRHIDTAQMYGNELGVGNALAATDIPREDIFLTTKLNTPNHRPDDVRRTFAQSLVDLQTDYVDLFLIHWPMPMYYGGDFITTYRVMEEFVASGQARAIGVSNFEIHHLEKLLSGVSIKPAVNQVEIHPYFTNTELAAYCAEYGIAVEAWSPLGRGRVLNDAVIGAIANEIQATPAQVVLAWHLAKGHIAIPKSTHVERQRENFGALDVKLSEAQIAAIDSLDKGEPGRTGKHPDVFDRL
ncbi:aldo/keto reductase [Trueperella pecoris]|uniref:Aldo/keto reductase n=1 Tax=Trueperella pecoris TaxID=2733571 RepID=A0A7M1R0B3_9ACTO|nr:aldo/keto reductase [Trueperella pecoris]QOR47709.1 aldo/keto reductase [Trueperella pecoris]